MNPELTPEQLEVLMCQLRCGAPRVPEAYPYPIEPPRSDPTYDPLSDWLDEPFPEEYD